MFKLFTILLERLGFTPVTTALTATSFYNTKGWEGNFEKLLFFGELNFLMQVAKLMISNKAVLLQLISFNSVAQVKPIFFGKNKNFLYFYKFYVFVDLKWLVRTIKKKPNLFVYCNNKAVMLYWWTWNEDYRIFKETIAFCYVEVSLNSFAAEAFVSCMKVCIT